MEYIQNIGKKLSKARELRPGLREEVYVLTDYMSEIATPTEVTARGIVGLLFLIVEDVQNKQKGFFKHPLPNALIRNQEQIFELASELPMVIEAIVDNEKFVKEFNREYERYLKHHS